MNNRVRLTIAATALGQLLMVAIAAIAAYYLTRYVTIIPKSVLPLPPVYVSPADMWSIVGIFVATYTVQVGALAVIYRTPAFEGPQRFANEYLWFLFAYTTASLYAFLATTINYDAQLVAAIGLLLTLFYVFAFIFVNLLSGRSLSATLGQGALALLKRVASLPGLLALLYFLLPLVLGLAFAKDRDTANRITQIRIWFNPVADSDWGFRNFFPGVVFEQPLLVVEAPRDPGAVYVLERVGRVYRVPVDTERERELVLDLRDALGEVEVENGALGLAFHPRFNDDTGGYQFAYLYYTDTRPEDGQLNRLSRFDFSLGDLQERRASETSIFDLQRESSGFHNGGAVLFGPDGYLYVALGEGVRTPQGSTSAKALRAGIFRIDVDQSPENLDIEPFEFGRLTGYRVPRDNPFIDNPLVRNEYWALGLRNPFRVNFDPATGNLWAGDVGSTVWEEINLIEPGKHYGYPMMEGREATGKSGWESLGLPLQDPVYTYVHDAYDRAVIGGIVYRGNRYTGLRDQYVFADNYSAKLFAMPADQAHVDEVTVLARANQYAQRGVSSVTQLRSGEILVTTLGAASEPSGEVLLLVQASEADVVSQGVNTTVREQDSNYDERATASLFNVNCARCHGVEGTGNGPDSDMLGVAIADMTHPLYHASRSSTDIRRVIAEGGAAAGMSVMMPPWEGMLTPREIDHLVLYIESLPDKHHRH